MSFGEGIRLGMQFLGDALVWAAAGYAIVALCCVLRNRGNTRAGSTAAPRPVSVLKPLRGMAPHLYENLRSFCTQDHPDYELVFGVREADDPAIGVVARLRSEFPALAIKLVVDPCIHGANPKVGNLINLFPQAGYDLLVIADADIAVPPDYLARVAVPLADPGVGIVTCLYRGLARGGFWARLGRLFIDDWFIPSVRLAHAFGSTRFAFGSTIALRRETLAAIGGFEALRDLLADDFWLGELTRRQGLRTVLSEVVVDTDVEEDDFASLWAHELRWLRTIRSIAPAGFAMTWVCFTTPVLLLGLCLAPGLPNACVAALGAVARALLNFRQQHPQGGASRWRDLPLVPVRDGLLLLEWAAALAGRHVQWQGQTLRARNGGPTSS
jgi:ceramide glucosyltransferase